MSEFPEFNAPPWRVRKFRTSDIHLIRKASSDPLIPLITSVPALFSEAEGQAYIERQWSRHTNGTGYSFAIAEADNDNAIGSVYLGFKEDGRASMGYWIVQEARGKGAAKVALKEVAKWAQTELQIPRLELYAEPWNIASIKTAEAVGFKQEGIMRSWQKVGTERKDMVMLSLLR